MATHIVVYCEVLATHILVYCEALATLILVYCEALATHIVVYCEVLATHILVYCVGDLEHVLNIIQSGKVLCFSILRFYFTNHITIGQKTCFYSERFNYCPEPKMLIYHLQIDQF